MKEKFSIMKRKLLKQEGVTLLELLITISLVGLIFGLGIYPMLSQIRLFKVERAEIALFDDANLVANYIARDAMMSEKADDTTANEITFTITTTYPATKTVQYRVINDTELERNDSVEGLMVITNKIDGVAVNGNPASLPNFDIDPDASAENHRLQCSLSFQDPDDASIATERSFDVMLRCRDAKLVKP